MCATLILLLPIVSSCIIIKKTVEIDEIGLSTSRLIRSPVRAHMVDGTTVVFAKGAAVSDSGLTGAGWRFDLGLRDSLPVRALSLDSIVAVETYRRVTDGNASVNYSLGLTALAALGVGAAVASHCASNPKCFGSCPTIYSDSGGVAVLEAEGFSYSIAPLFEARDVDRLRATPDSAGVVRLEVRNEAFETHYVNHFELLETQHAPDEWVLPAADGRILAVRGLGPVRTAIDGAGRDVAEVLAAHDGRLFGTAPAVLASTGAESLEDVIEIELADDPATDSVVLVFRMRNSLLATVLFYDLMLGDRGARALDWQAFDLDRLSTAVEIGEWARTHLGMRVSVTRNGSLEPVGRIGDSGPVAWKDIAIVVPVPDRGGRIRLAFPADAWRIDRVAVSDEWRMIEPRAIRIARVSHGGGLDSTALASLVRSDTRYLVTTAGQAFTAEFDVGLGVEPRTFLLASQGYYIEWIRREWLASGRDSTAFRPTRASLADAMKRWSLVQKSMEQQFYETRVPVR